MPLIFSGIAFGCVLLAAGAAHALTLSSGDVKPGGWISDEQALNTFGCTGGNLSPELHWSGAPKGTRSFAFSVFDIDAPTGHGFWHWVIFDIPPAAASLAKDAGDPRSGKAPAGAVQTRNDFGMLGYGGPCPPKGDKPHHYRFTVYAVDVARLDAGEAPSAAAVGARLRLHTLAKATLTGVRGR
jgi:Raf kinase inhibitor-like YbhB/YbcL family protein